MPIFSHPLAPKWRPLVCWSTTSIPAELLPWLADPGSMTKRLRQASQQSFHVQVLKCHWSQAGVTEAMRLNLQRRQRTYIREVLLFVDEKPWVYGRTIIPLTSLVGKNGSLLSLGTRPLGELLFSDPQVTRSVFEIASLQPNEHEYNAVTEHLNIHPAELWARRSVFHLHQQPLLVTEVMLPDLMSKNK